MHWDDVAVSDRGERHEAEVQRVSDDGRPVLPGRHAPEGVRHQQAERSVEPRERGADHQIQHESADESMVGHPTGREHGAGDDPYQRATQDQRAGHVQVAAEHRRALKREHNPRHDQGDRHEDGSPGGPAAGRDEHRSQEHRRDDEGGQEERQHHTAPGREYANRRDDENRYRQLDSEHRKRRIGPALPQ